MVEIFGLPVLLSNKGPCTFMKTYLVVPGDSLVQFCEMALLVIFGSGLLQSVVAVGCGL